MDLDGLRLVHDFLALAGSTPALFRYHFAIALAIVAATIHLLNHTRGQLTIAHFATLTAAAFARLDGALRTSFSKNGVVG